MTLHHPKLKDLQNGGWYVLFHDGTVITENDMSWIKVPNKKDIRLMGLKWRHKQCEIEGKDNYLPPGQTHCRNFSVNSGNEIQISKQNILSRTIGYYDTDRKVIYRVDVNTGKFVIEEIMYDPSKSPEDGPS